MARPSELPALTGLRFFAALWVVLFHTMPRASMPAPVAQFFAHGWSGVTLFFILSGFILAHVYDRSDRVSAARFYRARAARVYPAYAAALLFALPLFLRDARVAAPPLGTGQTVAIGASAIAMLQAWVPGWGCWWNCPGWSLSVEAFYYLLFPVLLPLIVRRATRDCVLIAGACLLAAIAIGLLDQGGGTEWSAGATTPLARWGLSGWSPIVRLPEFILGIAAARLMRGRALSRVARRVAAGSGIVAAIAITAFTPPWATGLLLSALLLVPFTALIVGWASSDPTGWASRPLVVRLGEASYALYLFHAPLHSYLLAVATRVGLSAWIEGWALFGVYLALAFLLATAVHRWIERPARERWRPRGMGNEPPLPIS
ncbi:MAG: acyltransferase [Gemmatimonadaceae bacterium]|nr:acyltransferase [Gemmatimonadaceae bacterium]